MQTVAYFATKCFWHECGEQPDITARLMGTDYTHLSLQTKPTYLKTYIQISMLWLTNLITAARDTRTPLHLH